MRANDAHTVANDFFELMDLFKSMSPDTRAEFLAKGRAYNDPSITEFMDAMEAYGEAFIGKDIPALFEQLKAIRDRESATDEESRSGYPEYRKLQRIITAMTPTSARDLAIQMVVETDFGDSEWRDSFFQKVTRLSEA